MAKGYSISIASDTREFASGVRKGIVGPLDDAVDALVDLARESSRSGDKLGDELDSGARKAENGVERLERQMRESMRDIQDRAQKTGRTVDDDLGGGFDRAREGVRSFKEEGIQNFSEFASSFDGSMDSVSDGVQGLTGGLATALPPLVGIPIAAAGAIAAGVLQATADAAEQQKEKVEGFFAAMVEAKSRYLTESALVDEAQRLLESDDEGDKKLLENARATADAIGVPYATLVAALAGVPAAQDEARAGIDRNYDALTVKSQDMNAKVSSDATSLLNSFDAVTEGIDNTNTAMGEAGDKYGTLSEITDNLRTDTLNAKSGIDDLNSSFAQTPDRKTISIEIDTSQYDSFERKVKQGLTASLVYTVDGKYGKALF